MKIEKTNLVRTLQLNNKKYAKENCPVSKALAGTEIRLKAKLL